jgi:DNA-binding NtrC family response regulator
MNYANPILICDENEEFRILLRDMLTRNGFFHVIEAARLQEAIDYLSSKNDFFVLLDSKITGDEIISQLHRQKNFLIYADKSEARTTGLAVKLGVQHVVSYPLTSKKLMEKIASLL